MLLHLKAILKSLFTAVIIFLLFIAVCGIDAILGSVIVALIAFIIGYASFLYEQYKNKRTK
ncbi:hypothetical protein RCL10_10710 [Staphylococcus lloydii]|uniref:hypothetical protein n=1 Tax=Staphylococcus lloydii TaxID=2781774 RepID=UPI002929C59D|nr:hypothetical protein [Staphylococcus lloydii]MDU9418967.1 hypothetical protein [Staphylococcus lloydii]